MKKRLVKSKNNVVVSGVLGGIGEYLGIDPTIVRVLYIVGTFVFIGSPFLLYFILMIAMPSDRGNDSNPYQQDRQQRDRYSSHHNYESKGSKRKEAEKVKDDDWGDF